MTEPKKRGRPPGSGKKKELIQVPTPDKPVILNGPVFDAGRIQKRLNELTNHEPIPYEETPFPDNWSAMGKIDRLKWLTANR